MSKKSIKDISDDFSVLIWDSILKIKESMYNMVPQTQSDFLDLGNGLFVIFLLSLSVWYLRMEFNFQSSRQKVVQSRP